MKPDDLVFWEDDRAGVGRIACAKAVCAVCPVADDCLEYALDTGRTDGVWGGKPRGRAADGTPPPAAAAAAA
ncbi:MAG: WhiB family transcriptional regulator [Egibacteraceae bacterium]